MNVLAPGLPTKFSDFMLRNTQPRARSASLQRQNTHCRTNHTSGPIPDGPRRARSACLAMSNYYLPFQLSVLNGMQHPLEFTRGDTYTGRPRNFAFCLESFCSPMVGEAAQPLSRGSAVSPPKNSVGPTKMRPNAANAFSNAAPPSFLRVPTQVAEHYAFPGRHKCPKTARAPFFSFRRRNRAPVASRAISPRGTRTARPSRPRARD